MKAHEDYLPWPVLREKLDMLEVALDSNDVAAVRAMLETLVSGYCPHDEIVDRVHLEQQTNQTGEAALQCVSV